MFVNEIVTSPVLVEGRKFVERTINSEFKRGKVSITTTYMNNKPLLKKYFFCGHNKMKNVCKKVSDKENKLDILG